MPIVDFPIKAGTAGGMFSALFLQIQPYDVLHTASVATMGAIVSFAVSTALKWCWEHWRKRR